MPAAAAPGHRPAVLRRALRQVATVTATIALALTASTALGSPPSPDEVAAQQSAERLQADVEAGQQATTLAEARLAELSAAAGVALEDYQQARRERFDAEAAHWVQSEHLVAAERSARASRGELGRWAAQTYRNGTGGSLAGLDALLGAQSTDDLGQRLELLEVVGRSRGAAADSLSAAATEQASVTAATEQTARSVLDATVRVTAAKEESDRLVAEQRAELAVLEAGLARTRDAASAADAQAGRLEAARVLADQAEAAARASAQAGQVAPGLPGAYGGNGTAPGVGPSGATTACAGQDLSWFANGQVPADALCPLWGAPGHLLRGDAAYAFDQLAAAWAADHGTPLCVTDSYRPLEDQVRLFATKPQLAARPGTSNHGWGVAVDLCGGIQAFGTSEHGWMQRNAPLYGWFNPRWAQQGGSRPEAWHWEYGG